MYAVTVIFTIKPDRMAKFMPLMEENATTSLRDEDGCHQFDICTDPSVADQVFLYELYSDRAAFAAHMETAHFTAFDKATSDMIATKTVQCYERVTQ